MPIDDQYIDRFYKEAINGRKGNLFTRIEKLEELIRNVQVRDVTNHITQIINQEKEIILSSVAGGTTDPTDAAFTGVVISPSGQTIDGVLYNFALVEDGVVITGWGDDGASVIVGGGDVFSDEAVADVSEIVVFSNVDGKHIQGAGLTITEMTGKGGILYLDDAASGISTYKTINRDYDALTSGSTSVYFAASAGGLIEGFITPELGVPSFRGLGLFFEVWMSSDVDETVSNIGAELFTRDLGGTETSLGILFLINSPSEDLTASPLKVRFYSTMSFNGLGLLETDRLLIKLTMSSANNNETITVHHGDSSTPSLLTFPYLDQNAFGGIGTGGGSASLPQILAVSSIGV